MEVRSVKLAKNPKEIGITNVRPVLCIEFYYFSKQSIIRQLAIVVLVNYIRRDKHSTYKTSLKGL